MRPNRIDRPFIAAASITASLALAGCGHNKSTTATQVVAKVNGREVTVSQLNQVLASLNANGSDSNAVKQAMNSLITEELAVQAAQRDKLDKDPAVQIRIDAAKRAVLARAYTERHIFSRSPVADLDLQQFYDRNPTVFSARRVYRFAGFSTSTADLPADAIKELDSAHTSDGVRAILEKRKIEFQIGEMVRGAEGFPTDLANRLSKANVGDIVITKGGNGNSELLLLTKIDEAPLKFEQVKGAIVKYLSAQKNQAALNASIKDLEAKSKIEYLDGR